MKKLIIASFAVIALSGCKESARYYDCGTQSFTISDSKIVTNKGVIIEKNNGQFELQTLLGKVIYTVTDSTISVSVGGFSHLNKCKVNDAK